MHLTRKNKGWLVGQFMLFMVTAMMLNDKITLYNPYPTAHNAYCIVYNLGLTTN